MNGRSSPPTLSYDDRNHNENQRSCFRFRRGFLPVFRLLCWWRDCLGRLKLRFVKRTRNRALGLVPKRDA